MYGLSWSDLYWLLTSILGGGITGGGGGVEGGGVGVGGGGWSYRIKSMIGHSCRPEYATPYNQVGDGI